MANIQKIDRKGGLTYKIIITHGRNVNGKQVRHFKTWKPPEGMSEKKAEKEVQRVAFEYEREIEQGFVDDNRQTFAEYAKYVLDMKTQGGAKHNTIREYEFLLKRINESMIGSLKLTEIRPQHLNMFYKELQAEGTRDEEMKAKAKARLQKELDERLISHASLSSAAHISHTTTAIACRGETISESSARAIAQALDCNVRDLFTLTKNNRPLSSKTILEHHRLIHTILDMAEREMLIPYNAAEKAIPPKYRRKTPNYFQPEQIVDILSALDQEPIKWQALTHLLLVTGCRRGEIAALKWTKIDLDAARIEISANLCYSAQQGTYETTTKTEATRYIKIPAETVELLKRYRVAQAEHRLACGDRWQNSAYVFTQETGGPMNPTSITAYLRKFSERYGLPHINPHAFRHTVASVLIANGTDIVTVSKQLGHAQVSTTSDVYSHVIEAAKAEATECIADVLLRRKQA